MQASSELVADLNWIAKNRAHFSMRSEPSVCPLALQMLSELATLYVYLRGWPLNSIVDPNWFLETVRDFIIANVEDKLYQESFRRQVGYSRHLLLPYLLLRATGYRNDVIEEAIELLEAFSCLEIPEVAPYRRMDQMHALWKSGLRGAPAWSDLYADTVAARWSCLSTFQKPEAYALTHVMFYLTDFGNQPVPLPAQEVEILIGKFTALLIRYLRIGEWDLVGELLIGLRVLKCEDGPLVLAARHALSKARRPDGGIPGSLASARLAKATGDAQAAEAQEFRLCYHTTIVSAIYNAITVSSR
jgi:hypothetical protein